MSSPSASPSSSPDASTTEILTPSRKVQALLARFDDSDEEDDVIITKPGVERVYADRKTEDGLRSELSDDELPVARKSRMAARLQDEDPVTGDAMKDAQSIQQSAPRSITFRDSNELPSSSQPAQSSGDELSHTAPRRRLLLKRKTNPTSPANPSQQSVNPPSPMFFSSPSASKSDPRSSPLRYDSDSEELPQNPFEAPKVKFLALVEKHRKQRLEKEAAEAAKREAQAKSVQHDERPRKQRVSSPVDDSDEDSDASAVSMAKKLTQEAKPLRKASKKAVEEMKRETQRMSRNMQLAHQARTKKKITKQSLLARFNFSLTSPVAHEPAVASSSTGASSNAGSDVEARDLTTPPTSPPHEVMDGIDKDKGFAQQTDLAVDLSATNDLVLEPRPRDGLHLPDSLDLDKGKTKVVDQPHATDSAPVTAKSAYVDLSQPLSFSTSSAKTEKRINLRDLLKNRKPLIEEEDLDVVMNRGDRRKYAAFEKLPKRKAQETSSHLALRSLAHLHDPEKPGRSSMNPTELGLSLRRAARLQARQERQQKIEELRAKGVVIQTAEERERDQQEVEDLVERARQEAAEIQKREKELAKKNGTYVKDGIDSDESDDGDFEDFEDGGGSGDSDEGEEIDESEAEETENLVDGDGQLIDDAAEENDSEQEEEDADEDESSEHEAEGQTDGEQEDAILPRRSRQSRVIGDDEEESFEASTIQSPKLLDPAKTPQSLSRSARKQIPGLEMSDDLPIGLSQAFAATMADSQTQQESHIQEQDSFDIIQELPSPGVAIMPRLNRLESLDVVSNSQQSETQPLNISLSLSQSQQVPESPLTRRRTEQVQFTPSQGPFEPTQDNGYMFSPFQGRRFDTPQHAPHSTVDTVILPNEVDASPVVQRKGRLRRGRVAAASSEDEKQTEATDTSAFGIMKRAAKNSGDQAFDRNKSNAREIVDEAAEESDDEYAGLGGVSDDELNDAENEDDRQMIDHDTQVGRGDEAKLAGLFADRERKNDEAAVSKLLKDITTGALRRKRGVNDDLDLSDEEDAVSRRREAKRREFAKMRRELLKDEAVGKIAEDRKKEAFLRSIEDREPISDDDEGLDQPETPADEPQSQSQSQAQAQALPPGETQESVQTREKRKRPLETTSDSQLNRLPPALRYTTNTNKRPSTLAEIRESVSFLIEEPDSQAAVVDLGLSDSEEEPEAYVDLDRHLQTADADEHAAASDDDEGLADFIVDDDGSARDAQENNAFKKPLVPVRANFAERRTRANVVNRLSLLRQSSSTSSNSNSTKMAFYASTSNGSLKVPSLLRRATTNSSISSISSGENVSATGVTTARTERGNASAEKEFVRKGKSGSRNAVNYQGPARMTVREEKMKQRAGINKKTKKNSGGFLGGLFGGGSWS